MRKVQVQALQEGMRVAVDVKNIDDMLLVPAGTELTARHIRILQTWGVSEVGVESHGADEEDADPLAHLPPETLAQLKAELKQRFLQHDETCAPQRELFRLALRRRASALVKP